MHIKCVGDSHLEKGVNLEKRLEKINFKEGSIYCKKDLLELLWVLCVICKWARGIFVRFCCLPLRGGSGLKYKKQMAYHS